MAKGTSVAKVVGKLTAAQQRDLVALHKLGATTKVPVSRQQVAAQTGISKGYALRWGAYTRAPLPQSLQGMGLIAQSHNGATLTALGTRVAKALQ